MKTENKKQFNTSSFIIECWIPASWQAGWKLLFLPNEQIKILNAIKYWWPLTINNLYYGYITNNYPQILRQ